MNIAELIKEFRDMSYETGWISGKIEAGGNHSESDQDNCIAKRNELEADLTNRIADLMEALKHIANPPISPPSDIVFWAKDIAKQAIAEAKGKDDDN